MPHYQNGGKTYLVTFVTLDRWELPPIARDIALAEIVALHDTMTWIHVAVVMPDHVHMVTQPLCDEMGITYPLPSILKLMKGRSARRINIAMHLSGSVWLQEFHDYQLRNDESLEKKIEYVMNNPVRRGLVQSADEYPWLWRSWVDGLKPVLHSTG